MLLGMKPSLKELKVLFYGKGLDGVLAIKEDGWKNGTILTCPIEEISELRAQEEAIRPGIGILISSNEVLIGRWFNLEEYGNSESDCVNCHVADHGDWERIVILTMEDNSFRGAAFEYLMARLRKIAKECGTLSTKSPEIMAKHEPDKFEKAALDQYLEGALFILGFMGIDVFRKRKDAPFIPDAPALLLKSEALSYLKAKGVDFGAKYVSYARRQMNKKEFWNNARASEIDAPWVLALNDQLKRRLYVLEIPAMAFETTKFPQKGKILLRSDKPYYLDLHIDAVSLVDDKSGIDFSRFVTRTFDY